MSRSFYPNHRNSNWRAVAPVPEIREFHKSLPDYAVTPLVHLPEMARSLGVAHVFAKDESMRLGLPAFKGLGASWAVHKAINQIAAGKEITIVTATDGNHGRAIARFARIANQKALIWIPKGVHPKAIQAIRDEGAEVFVLDATYDETVAAAADSARQEGRVLIQDTAWEGYEEIPSWIVDGYETLFSEIDEQLRDLGVNQPDLIAVPTGVGSLLQSALNHYRNETSNGGTSVVSVEPFAASCVAPSLEAGKPVTVQTGETIMSGLNCGTPSYLAWPAIQNGLDAAISISEDEDIVSAKELEKQGLTVGPCGAAGLAGLKSALVGEASDFQRKHLGIDESSTVVFLITEGADANPMPA